MDNTERKILDIRGELDSYTPAEHCWNNIENRLDSIEKWDLTLENTVRLNREAFDAFAPPNGWTGTLSRLEAGAPQKGKQVKMLPQQLVLKVAAAVLLLFAALFGYQEYRHENLRTSPGIVENSLIPAELSEAEKYYTTLIGLKTQELNTYRNKGQAQQVDGFLQDVANLDMAYQALKEELLENQNPEAVTRAMAENLQLRIGLLNQQLDILKSTLQPENNNEKEL